MPLDCEHAAPDTALAAPADAGWQHLQAVPGSTVEKLDIEPGLTVVRSSVLPRDEVREASTNPPGRGTLVLTIGLEGRSAFRGARGEHLGFAAGYVTAAAFVCSAGERCYAAGERVVQLRLLVDEDAVARWLGPEVCRRLMPARGVRALSSARSSPGGIAHAQALLRGAGARGLAALDRRIHALSLLAEQVRVLGLSLPAASGPSRRHEHDRLARARDLMHARLDRPLTIAGLAAEVGMSETRFKAGFREAFGVPPGQMLLQLRMERAKALLDAGCQVAQAGWQVGYAHPGNFSTAFTRHVGCTPRDWLTKAARRR